MAWMPWRRNMDFLVPAGTSTWLDWMQCDFNIHPSLPFLVFYRDFSRSWASKKHPFSVEKWNAHAVPNLPGVGGRALVKFKLCILHDLGQAPTKNNQFICNSLPQSVTWLYFGMSPFRINLESQTMINNSISQMYINPRRICYWSCSDITSSLPLEKIKMEWRISKWIEKEA
jgi:hypothetical protein